MVPDFASITIGRTGFLGRIRLNVAVAMGSLAIQPARDAALGFPRNGSSNRHATAPAHDRQGRMCAVIGRRAARPFRQKYRNFCSSHTK